MNPILLAVLIVAGIGIVVGILLAVFSTLLSVPVDEKAAEIETILPGVNCGACGFSGCSGYASALSSGKTDNTGLCAPGGNEVSKKIAAYLGLSAENVAPMTAVVFCRGNSLNAKRKMVYAGVSSCKLAAQLFGGGKECMYGCIGLGDCVNECPYQAISLCDGVAVVDPDRCRACKRCVNVCPKKIIGLVPKVTASAVVLCRNHDKGALTRKECVTGCIGCTKCVKACPVGAVSMENNVAVVNFGKCIACGTCVEGCPTQAITFMPMIPESTLPDGCVKTGKPQ